MDIIGEFYSLLDFLGTAGANFLKFVFSFVKDYNTIFRVVFPTFPDFLVEGISILVGALFILLVLQILSKLAALIVKLLVTGGA